MGPLASTLFFVARRTKVKTICIILRFFACFASVLCSALCYMSSKGEHRTVNIVRCKVKSAFLHFLFIGNTIFADSYCLKKEHIAFSPTLCVCVLVDDDDTIDDNPAHSI